MHSKGAYVSARCHSQVVIDLITKTLDNENLVKFQNGPFGHLLGLQHAPQNFQCQLFYDCMQMLNKSKQRKGVLVFNFNNSEVHFSRRDYFLMSGLKFGPIQKAPLTSDLHKTNFLGIKSLSMNVIKRTFATAKKDSPGGAGGGELCLKLANLLFVYGVLLCRDMEKKKFDIRYLHIVDDIEKFNQYPWGLVSYNYFVREFILSCDRMNDFVSTADGRPNYEIFGFLFVFQYWMYEIFPLLGENCGLRSEGWENIYLRVLRWKAAPGPWTFKKVHDLFSRSASLAVLHPLIMSDEEHPRFVEAEQFLEEDIEALMCQPDSPVLERKPRKRKLNLRSGECSKKPRVKGNYKLCSSVEEVAKDEAEKSALQDDEEPVHEKSRPMKTANHTWDSHSLQVITSRLNNLEAYCSSLNEKVSKLFLYFEEMRTEQMKRTEMRRGGMEILHEVRDLSNCALHAILR